MVESAAGTAEDGTRDEVVALLRSINAMMEKREKRAAAKETARMSAQNGASASKMNEAATPVVSSDEGVVSMLSQMFDGLKDVKLKADVSKQSGARARMTVVGMLSQIIDALKDMGLNHDKNKNEQKKSPFPKKRFGLDSQQAQRGNGAVFRFQFPRSPVRLLNRKLRLQGEISGG